MTPSGTSDAWRSLAKVPSADLSGIQWIDCPSIEEEAAVIALKLREAQSGLENRPPWSRRTGISPACCRKPSRWGIEIDDSAGLPLGRPPGAFLRLLAACVADGFSLSFSSLLYTVGSRRTGSGIFPGGGTPLDREVLRGPRPAAGLNGLWLRPAIAQMPQSVHCHRSMKLPTGSSVSSNP